MTGARIKAHLSGGSRPTAPQFWPNLPLPDRADALVSGQGQMAVGLGGPHQWDSALLYVFSSCFFLSLSLSLQLLCCFYPSTLFKDNLKNLPSGASAQVYFEIHHVSSCGFSTGTMRMEVMGVLVLGQRNAVIVSALIPEEAGSTSDTQIIPPSHPSNC